MAAGDASFIQRSQAARRQTSRLSRADYVQKNSATVESVLEAILRTHRSAEERPASIKENALRLLPETKPELIEATAAAYKELRIWDVNGGASKDRGDASIKFFEESG